MNIIIIEPAPPASDLGSETTTSRWEHLMEDLGYTVETSYDYGQGEPVFEEGDHDLMVALDASKSGESITFFKETYPDRPLVVALSGSDLYLNGDREPVVDRCMELADSLVAFEDMAPSAVPGKYRDKVRVIYQSADFLWDTPENIPRRPIESQRESNINRLEVCVAAPLQHSKDPLRAAKAAALMNEESKLLVKHVGRALEPEWERQARRESANNPRYEWLGEVPRQKALELMQRSDLVCVTSVLESGPNVISEAVTLETPVLASRIPGNVGVVGETYPGLFEPKDEEDLADRFRAVEGGTRFYNDLKVRCQEMKERFLPARERHSWAKLLEHLH